MITSVRAKVRQRAVPPSAALVVVGVSGGPTEAPVELHFNLDGVDLDARTIDRRGRWGGKYLDAHGLTLEAGEKLRFNLIGHATTGLVDWVVQVGYVVNGDVRVLEVAPRSRAMRVAGPSPRYREAYTWNAVGLNRTPLKDLCPVDCRRQIVAGIQE